MTLDDLYGRDTVRYANEHKSTWRDQIPPEIDWDESEVAEVVDQFVHQHLSPE